MHASSESHALLALGLGLTAAAANVLGGLTIVRRDWPRQYLKYFIALGAGFMLAAAFLEIIPESIRLAGRHALLLVLAGYFLVHFFEHTLAPHFHFGEETHLQEMTPQHAGYTAL
ncbi:MAG: ZIP family magnesium transporter, partial [Acidobacteria bacterium]